MTHKYRLPVSLLLLSAYFFIAFFVKRTDTAALLASVAVVSGLYAMLIRPRSIPPEQFNYFMGLAFALRLVFLFVPTALSDDVYRFIWDGRLMEAGINPYAYLPEDLIRSRLADRESFAALFPQINSPGYYSLYPPVLQGLFFLAVKCSFGMQALAVLNLRLLVLAAECGTFFFLGRILELLRINRDRIFVYAFNPLVIIELSGNVHPESVMIFFLSGALYFLLLRRTSWSAVWFALAVSTKVIPLVLLPLIIRKKGLRTGIAFAALTAVICIALFVPFANPVLLHNLTESFCLYFHQFEFNASIYYLTKWLECRVMGQETIRYTAIVLPMLSTGIILWLSFYLKKKDDWPVVFERALAVLSAYYLFSPVVHPWYLTFPVVLSVFVPFRYALVWSVLAFLSYAHYAVFPYREPVLLLWTEYLIVGLGVLLEYNVSLYKK